MDIIWFVWTDGEIQVRLMKMAIGKVIHLTGSMIMHGGHNIYRVKV